MILKIAFIHNIISPHNNPLFRQLFKRSDLKIKFFFLSPTDPNRPWVHSEELGFDYQILPGNRLTLGGKDSFSFYFNPSIINILKSYNPDIVLISGWDHPSYGMAVLYAKVFKKKLVLWSGSTAYETSWRRTITRPFVRVLIRLSDKFVAYGTRSKEYLISLGAPAGKIIISYNTTDLNKYSSAIKLRKDRQSQLKKSLGLSGKTLILYYGQLIGRKGVLQLLEAFKEVRKSQPDLGLLIVGNGNLEEKIKIYVNENKLINSVKLFKYPGENVIVSYFASADLFVLPSSQEVWGLVVNQALAAGLPVIATDQAGSTLDLIKSDENGFIITNSTPNAIALGLKHILGQDLKKMSKSAVQSVYRLTPKLVAKEFGDSLIFR